MEEQGFEFVSPEFLQNADPYKRTPRLRLLAVSHLLGQEHFMLADTAHLIEEAEKLVEYIAGPVADEAITFTPDNDDGNDVKGWENDGGYI